MIFPIVRPIVFDFETFYKEGGCSVRAHKNGWVGGPWHYTHHPEFYSYMVSYFDPISGERGVLDDPTHMNNFIESLDGRTVIAHNAGFDDAVAKQRARFNPLNMFDTADMASYLQVGRSLLEAAGTLLGVSMDKGLRDGMNGKHYRDLDPAARVAMKEYALKDSVTTGQLFLQYKDQWPDIEKWMSDFNRRQNWDGIRIDQNYLQDQIDLISAVRSKAVRAIPWVEDIELDKPLSAKKLALYCREVGIPAPESLAEDSEECQEWENAYGDTYPVVGALRDFRKANTYYKKLQLIERLLRPDGTIPLSTKYAAAPHTLRFSATQFNYQSLPRDKSVCDLRGCIIPSEGHAFTPSDLAGIEARCLPWLAGDMPYLDEVRRLDEQAVAAGLTGGGDIYEPAARRMFGYTDPRPLKKVDKVLRDATKVCVLQLGYQSGWKKFLHYLNNNISPAVLDRVRLANETDEGLSHRLVKLYRGLNTKVTGLWYSLDNELRNSQIMGTDFTVQQPNGRQVNYYDLGMQTNTKEDGTVRTEVVGKNYRGGKFTKLYGGKITENVCQEMARHVLVQSIYNLTQEGYRIRFSVHDENVIEVPLDKATKETTRDIDRIMSITPDWAPGLPLAAETNILHRYAK